MNFELLLFYLFSSVTLLAAIGVVTVRNTVYAALCLILAFFSSASLWILLQAEFLGIVLVLVYVGAVMVLFLFVIMMLDVKRESGSERFTRYFPFGLVVALTIAVEMLLIIRHSGFNDPQRYSAVSQAADYSNTKALGELLYQDYLYPFEIAGVILLVAMIAAIVLTLRQRSQSQVHSIAKQVRVQRQDRVRLVKMKSESRE